MRPLFALFLCLLLAGCFGRKPQPPAPKPSPSPAAAKPTPSPSPTPVVEKKPAVALFNHDHPAVWTTNDPAGQSFDLVLFPNGQLTNNWTKGKTGAQGDHGTWHQEGERLVIIYDDGRKDIVQAQGGEFQRQEFPATAPPNAPATGSAPFQAVTGKVTDFVGVWRLNAEPDGFYEYLALLSDGRAFSNINGGTEGTWKVTEKGAECRWSDGWADLITKGDKGWEKRTSVGTSTAIIDTAPAQRLGESGPVTP